MPDSAPQRAAPQSAAERLAGVLREDILAGRLTPGTPLPETTVGARFAVSRSTVREALRLLDQRGLVRIERHRGAAVTALTPAALEDLRRARRALEGAAGRAVTVEADLSALAAALARLDAAAAAGDADAVVDADLDFHAALVALLGSERLSACYDALQHELRLALNLTGRRVADPDKVAAHRHLLALARSGDGAALEAALAAHIDAGVTDQLRALAAPGQGP